MRALLRSLSAALTILLVSSTASAQIAPGSGPGPGTGPGKPGEPTSCPTVTVEPARGWCQGWELSQACAGTVVTVVIHNTTSCAIPFFRIQPMPHSQGMNYSICAPGMAASRVNCGVDAITVSMDQKPLQPGENAEFQLLADRIGDLEIYTLCKENFQQCSVPVHIPMFPSPYPAGQPDPTQPRSSDPTQPAPTQTLTPDIPPGPGPAPVLAPSDRRPSDRELPGGIHEGGDGPQRVPGQ